MRNMTEAIARAVKNVTQELVMSKQLNVLQVDNFVARLAPAVCHNSNQWLSLH